MITVSLRFIADNSDNIRKHDQLLVALGYWMYGDNTSRFILFYLKTTKYYTRLPSHFQMS